MRLYSYLNEKFFDSAIMRNRTYEVFKNPSKDELKQLFNNEEADGRTFNDYTGFRIIVDVDNKNIYFTGDSIIHSQMLKIGSLMKELKISSYDNLIDGEYADRIMTLDAYTNMKSLNSDLLLHWEDRAKPSKISSIHDKLKKLQKKNLAFVSKYFSEKELRNLIDSTINVIERSL